MTDYKLIRINVSERAKGVIENIADKHGMKEVIVASKIYEWFGQQPDVFQKSILGMLPEGMESDVAKLALEQLAATGKGKSKGK